MKGKRTDLGKSDCALARTLDVIGDWWSLLIVRDALLGRERFSEFQKNIGLAKNILSTRLKKLVEDGVMEIVEDDASPPTRRYVLTDRGRQLAVIVTALWQWGEENRFKRGALKIGLADAASGRSIAKLALRTDDGRVIDPRKLRMTLKKIA